MAMGKLLANIIITVILSMNAIHANAEELNLFANGEMLVLPTSESSISVWFSDDEVNHADSILSEYPDIDLELGLKPIIANHYRAKIKMGRSTSGIISVLLADERIMDAAPVLLNEGDIESFFDKSLIVYINAENVNPFLDSVISAKNLDVLYEKGISTKRFLLINDSIPVLDLIDLAEEIELSGMVDMARVNIIYELELFMRPNDTYFQYQYYLDTGYSDFVEAWDYQTGTTDTTIVAFLDSGINPHEDLDSGLFKGGYNYTCFNSQTCDEEDYDDVSLPLNCPSQNASYEYHGIAVVGVTAAMINNDSIDVAGVNDKIGFVMQQIFDCDYFGNYAYGSSYLLSEAIRDAIDSFGVDIISNSWGFMDCSEPIPWESFITSAINYAVDTCGAVVIASSGNCDLASDAGLCVAYPARLSNVMAIGATIQNKTRYDYSMYDYDTTLISAMAAGFSITSLDVIGQDSGYHKVSSTVPCNNDYDVVCNMQGTSYAAPQVAGLAALIMQRRPDFVGQPDSIRHVLEYSTGNGWRSNPVEDTHTQNVETGYGIINAARALLAVSRGNVNNDVSWDNLDIAYLINYIYSSGPAPTPNWRLGDSDCSGAINVLDITYMINYVYNNQARPPLCFKY